MQLKKHPLVIPIISVLSISYIVFTTLLMWLIDKGIISLTLGHSSLPVGAFMYMPKVFIEFWILLMPAALLSANIQVYLWIEGIVLIIILIILSLNLGRYLYKTKKIIFQNLPWIRIVFITWILSIIAFGSSGTPAIQWQTTVRDVSRTIEYQQFSFLRPFVKYINRDNGYFSYQINTTGNEYFIMQQMQKNTWKTYQVKTSNIVKNAEIIKRPNTTITASYDGYDPLLLGVECRSKEEYYNSKNICNELWYQGKHIFTVPQSGVWVKQVLYNDRESNLLIHLSSGVYDPEYVYLVKFE